MRRVVLTALLLTGFAHTATAAPLTVDGGAKLFIDGTSTVRNFTCEAPEPPLKVKAGALEQRPLIEQLDKALEHVSLELPVEKLDCNNGTMNNHMRDALKAKEHPSIRFKMARYELGPAAGTTVPLKLVGEITLLGTTKPVTIEAKATQLDDGKLRVEGTYPLKMTEWGVQPPRLMLGTLKVGETVKVRFDLALKQP